MENFNYKKRYTNHQVAGKFLSQPKTGEKLVVALHGGPCLSGLYLEPFLKELAVVSGWNVVNLDLPNHDDSLLAETELPLSYTKCVEILGNVFKELREFDFDRVVILGHSLGARVALDLVANTGISVDGLILVSTPASLESSEEFKEGVEETSFSKPGSFSGPDEEFLDAWKKMLPLFIHGEVSPEIEFYATAGIRTVGNEKILGGMPALEETRNKWVGRLGLETASPCPIIFIQGDLDLRLPENNVEALRSLFPEASFRAASDCGHFPMLEKQSELVREVSEFLRLK